MRALWVRTVDAAWTLLMRRFSLALVALALVVSTSLAGCGQQEAPVRLEQEGALVVDGAQRAGRSARDANPVGS